MDERRFAENADDEIVIPPEIIANPQLPQEGIPVTPVAPAPNNETAPYEGEDGSMPFGDDDEVRDRNTGVGEQQGGYPGGSTTTGGKTSSLTE